MGHIPLPGLLLDLLGFSTGEMDFLLRYRENRIIATLIETGSKVMNRYRVLAKLSTKSKMVGSSGPSLQDYLKCF